MEAGFGFREAHDVFKLSVGIEFGLLFIGQTVFLLALYQFPDPLTHLFRCLEVRKAFRVFLHDEIYQFLVKGSDLLIGSTEISVCTSCTSAPLYQRNYADDLRRNIRLYHIRTHVNEVKGSRKVIIMPPCLWIVVGRFPRSLKTTIWH